MNNRTLLYIFLAALAVFIGAKILRKDRHSSFDPVLSAVDSTKVDRIKFISAGPAFEEFELIKTDTIWEAVKGDKRIPANASNVNAMLSQLSSLNAKRVVTKDKTNYSSYEITDEMAHRIMIYEGKKKVTDLLLGGFRFDQATRSASAFARRGDEPEVYEVDGFVIMTLKQDFDQYRDKTILKATAADLNRLDWTNASGRKEVIVKEDGLWHYAGMEAVDSLKMNNYLQALVNSRGTDFSDLNSITGLNLLERLTVSGNNMIEPVVISAFANNDTTHQFLIHSSINPEAFFLSDSSGLYRHIFQDLRQFWPNGQ